MARKRHSRGSDFKSKVACEVHPTQISTWKNGYAGSRQRAISGRSQRSKKAAEKEKEVSALHEQIGRLKMESEWLKHKKSISSTNLRLLVEPDWALSDSYPR